jgi:hypothetical protein
MDYIAAILLAVASVWLQPYVANALRSLTA